MKNKSQSIIYGIVSDHIGQPIKEARVYFVDGPVSLPDVAFLTDSNGKFSITAPAEGTYQIGYSADGFESTNVIVNIISGRDIKLKIKLNETR